MVQHTNTKISSWQACCRCSRPEKWHWDWFWNGWDIEVKNVLFWMEVPTNANIQLYYVHCNACLCFLHMVNGLHLYSAFIQSAVQFMHLIHPFTHTHIHTTTAIGCHARYQPARQEQLRVRCLAQAHFDMLRVWLATLRLPDDSSYLLLLSSYMHPYLWLWVLGPLICCLQLYFKPC